MARKPVEHRKVIIFGAGPGGTTCARRLSEAGIDVLVIEKREVVGNPAQCGECIPNWGEVHTTFKGISNHSWLEDSFEIPDRIRGHRLDAMRVFSPSGKSWMFDLDAFAGHRLQFDGYLADRAIDSGAEIRCSEALKNIIKRKDGSELFVTDVGRYTADYIIDATGALAHVSRLRHGSDKRYRPADQVPTIYAQVQGDVPETFDVFLGSVAPKGYAWIIPKGPDTANVGIGVRAGTLKGSLKEHLDGFCEKLGFEILSYGGGWIPMGGPVKRMVDGNVMAIGDAAGLVMPSNGGGISQAMISGCFAADAIIEHIDEGVDLSNYEKRVRKCMSKPLRTSLRSKRMSYAMMRGDMSTELILRILGPIGGIRRALECRAPLWLI